MSFEFLIKRPGETLNLIKEHALNIFYGRKKAIYRPKYFFKNELEIASNVGILRFGSKKDVVLGRYKIKGIPDFLNKKDKDFEEVYMAWKAGRKDLKS